MKPYLLLFASFCNDFTPIQASEISGTSYASAQHWYTKFRSRVAWLAQDDFSRNGVGFDVQIDESAMSHRKYHRGRLIKEKWVFGVCENERGGKVYMIPVPDRTAATLMPIILQATPPDAIVRSDKWKAYTGIDGQDRNHLEVNHSEHFVDPVTFSHTQRIEGLWNQCKLWRRARYYLHSKYIDQYVLEWVYRYNNQRDFNSLWTSIYTI